MHPVRSRSRSTPAGKLTKPLSRSRMTDSLLTTTGLRAETLVYFRFPPVALVGINYFGGSDGSFPSVGAPVPVEPKNKARPSENERFLPLIRGPPSFA